MRYLRSMLWISIALFACVACLNAKEDTGQLAAAKTSNATSQQAAASQPSNETAHGLTKMFFLHHSTGSGVVKKGDVRGQIAEYNKLHGTSFEFWDHGYEQNGLYDQHGNSTGTNYGPLTNQTNPPDLHALWTSTEQGWTELRNRILAEHEVISFKSCYPASNIKDAADLQYRKDIYLEMRDFFDTRPDKLFIVMSMPPLNPASTDSARAKLARQFANWLKSPEYLAGHPNVACFDLFDALAHGDDLSQQANMLRADYRKGDDSHPTALGYQAAGAALAEYFCATAAGY